MSLKTRLVKYFAIALLALILLGLAGLILYLWRNSPGTVPPILDANGKPLPGSLSEKTFVRIGGVPQGMIIRGRDLNNPVLLFVHGGPGFPEYFLVEEYPSGLENYFTVCYWEQRGSGLSYSQEVTLESMTLVQLTADALEVTDYLQKRFHKEKIYLMAHSGGTAFAIQAVAQAPQRYHAYIAMAQVTQQATSEKMAYRYIRDQYSRAGNGEGLAELRSFPILDHDSLVLNFFMSPFRDAAMHELGVGTMHTMKSVVSGVFYPVWTCHAYTFTEKVNFWEAKFIFLGKTSLPREVLALDVPRAVPRLEVPTYFFSGRYDWTVNYSLAKKYLQELESPVKGFYTFESSAHSPLFEEPNRVRAIMIQDVLQGLTDLADK